MREPVREPNSAASPALRRDRRGVTGPVGVAGPVGVVGPVGVAGPVGCTPASKSSSSIPAGKSVSDCSCGGLELVRGRKKVTIIEQGKT